MAERVTTPSTTIPASTSSTAMLAMIPSGVPALTPSMAVMATTPSKVVFSSTGAMAMTTPYSPRKHQQSISATATTLLMAVTHHKITG